MGETESISAEAVSRAIQGAIDAMAEAEKEIQRLHSVIDTLIPVVKLFPCVCIYVAGECATCQALAALEQEQ